MFRLAKYVRNQLELLSLKSIELFSRKMTSSILFSIKAVLNTEN